MPDGIIGCVQECGGQQTHGLDVSDVVLSIIAGNLVSPLLFACVVLSLF
jgi:hypothetical protein